MEWVLVVVAVVALLLVISVTGRNRQAERAQQAQLNRLETKLDAALGRQPPETDVTSRSVQAGQAVQAGEAIQAGEAVQAGPVEPERPATFVEGTEAAAGQSYSYPSYGDPQPATPTPAPASLAPGGVPGGVQSPHPLGHPVEQLQDPRLAEVNQLIREGKKIQAIKVYRELTGVGLRQAKEAVERISG